MAGTKYGNDLGNEENVVFSEMPMGTRIKQ